MPYEASSDLLISIWRDDAVVRTAMEIWLNVLREEIDEPGTQLQTMSTVETAEGVWLDYIGQRYGITRPEDLIAADSRRFGFDNAGLGFDQARFADLAQFERIEPVPDSVYRPIIQARAIAITSNADANSMEIALGYLYPEGTVTDNHDRTFTITVPQNRRLLDLALSRRALPVPAGIEIVVEVDNG